jgi:hypothetical protein
MLSVLLLLLLLPPGTAPYTTVGQRNETIVKGNEILIQTVYLLHELDEGTSLIRANRLSAANGALATRFVVEGGAVSGGQLCGGSNSRVSG